MDSVEPANPEPTIRIVADLGNSRLKWGRLDAEGTLIESLALPLEDPEAWAFAMKRLDPQGQGTRWAISTVHPSSADRLGSFLEARGALVEHWYRSAADVPLRHNLERPETTGADRALSVFAALNLNPKGRPGLVVSCGTAITVDRIDEEGIWQGGAIATGLGLAAWALHQGTAQLPQILLDGALEEPPPAWGRSTVPALTAGIFWGTVGALRELLARQARDLGADPWLLWTGGDATVLSAQVSGSESKIVPDLVLQGLARAAFGSGARLP